MGFLRRTLRHAHQYEYQPEGFFSALLPPGITIVWGADVKDEGGAHLGGEGLGAGGGAITAGNPRQPPQDGRHHHVAWSGPTLALLAIAYKGPAYDDSTKDTAALDALFVPCVFGELGPISKN